MLRYKSGAKRWGNDEGVLSSTFGVHARASALIRWTKTEIMHPLVHMMARKAACPDSGKKRKLDECKLNGSLFVGIRIANQQNVRSFTVRIEGQTIGGMACRAQRLKGCT